MTYTPQVALEVWSEVRHLVSNRMLRFRRELARRLRWTGDEWCHAWASWLGDQLETWLIEHDRRVARTVEENL